MQEKIIFINQKSSFRKAMEQGLGKEFRIIGKQDGLEALEWLEQEGDADLIIADLNMPHLSIFDFIKTIRIHPIFRNIPLIVLSDVDHVTERRKYLELGANEFMVKPVTVQGVRDKAKAILTKAKSQSRSEQILV